MDYEKKYNEALEKARIINSGKYVDIPVEDTVLEYVFPELKESEDEKIRKALIDALNKNLGNGIEKYGTTLNSTLAWLEKQGKKVIPKNIDDAALQYVDTCTVDGEVTHDNITEPYWNNHSMMNAYKAGWLEKQESVEEIVARCKDSWYNKGKITGMAEGLTDDEKYQQGWHDALEKQGEKFINETDEEIVKAVKDTSVLDMVEPKQEWSEEDFSYIDELTDFFEHCGELHQPQENVVKWLKSLKSRIGCEGYCTTK